MNVVVATVMVLAAALSSADAKTVRQSKSAKSGQSQWIDAFFGWNDDCSFKTINIDIVERPEHGSVSPRVETQRITQAQVGSTGKCLGRPTKAVAIYYKSKSGYRGRDDFKVRMRVGGQSPVFFVYQVNVR